jgi:hypothetical protein
VDWTADHRDEARGSRSDRSHTFLVAPEFFLYFLPFVQRESRFHRREGLRNSILRRHESFLPAGNLLSRRITSDCARRRGAAIRKAHRYPFYEMIFDWGRSIAEGQIPRASRNATAFASPQRLTRLLVESLMVVPAEPRQMWESA